jgi:hypothetical protein
MNELITVPLAHKIPAAEALRLGASEHRDYRPGEDITVPRASAEMLAAAAQLQVNPRDREAVARLLQGKPAPETAPAVAQAAPQQAPVTAPAVPTGPSTGTPAVAPTGTPTAVTAPATPQVPRN